MKITLTLAFGLLMFQCSLATITKFNVVMAAKRYDYCEKAKCDERAYKSCMGQMKGGTDPIDVWSLRQCFCCLPLCECKAEESEQPKGVPFPTSKHWDEEPTTKLFSYCNLKHAQCRSLTGRLVQETWLYCGLEIACSQTKVGQGKEVAVGLHCFKKNGSHMNGACNPTFPHEIVHQPTIPDKYSGMELCCNRKYETKQSRLAQALKRTESKIEHRLSQLQQLKLRESKIGKRLSQLRQFNKSMRK